MLHIKMALLIFSFTLLGSTAVQAMQNPATQSEKDTEAKRKELRAIMENIAIVDQHFSDMDRVSTKNDPHGIQKAFEWALTHEDDAKMLELLASEPRPNVNVAVRSYRSLRRDTALTYAVLFNKIDLVQALLDAGADVNAYDNDGLTPIMHAAAHGQLSTVQALLSAGANVNTKDRHYGQTALMYAIPNPYSELGDAADIVLALLAAGANVFMATEQLHQTALMLAAEYDRIKIAQILLDVSSQYFLNKKDFFCKTALDYARPDSEMTELLKSRGAKYGNELT